MLAVGGRRGTVASWCRECGARVQMLTAEEAARFAGTSTRMIYRRVEAGEIHYLETADGGLLVCARSVTSGIKKSAGEEE